MTEDILSKAINPDLLQGIQDLISQAMAQGQQQSQQGPGPAVPNVGEVSPGKWEPAGMRMVRKPYEMPPDPPPATEDPTGQQQGQGGAEGDADPFEALISEYALNMANLYSPDELSYTYRESPADEDAPEPAQFRAQDRARELAGDERMGQGRRQYQSLDDVPDELRDPLLMEAMKALEGLSPEEARMVLDYQAAQARGAQ